MLMQIGQKPESDFTQPIGMLEDCHKRILYFMGLLANLADAPSTSPLNAADRDSLERALRYFREAAPRHNADEEESLFPEMRRHWPDGAGDVLTQLAALEADHRWVEAQHNEIDDLGRHWLVAGTLGEKERARFKAIVHPLRRFYTHHIAIEEEQVFPAARKILSAGEQAKVGQEMADRRGLAARAARLKRSI